MGEATATRRPVPLAFADGRVLPPADLDAYALTAARAAEAFRGPVPPGGQIGHFEAHFVLPLRRWCEQHAAQVRACVVPLPNRRMQVFVVTTSPRYDFAFGEEIAALELQLARAGWRVGTMLLPDASPESHAAFYRADGALDVFPTRELVPDDAPQRGIDL